MNKKLLAAALGLAFAGAAQAQSNVTLYGIADGGIRFDKTSVGTLKSVNSGGESGTRWGLKGAEDLGGGLKAVFQFEQGFDLTDNSVVQGNIAGSAASSPSNSTGSRFFGRTSTVGLTGDFGGVKVGRGYTPYFLMWDNVDPMDAGLVGGAQNLVVGSTTRFDNGLYFDSANIYGIQFSIAEKFGKSTTDSTGTSSSTSTTQFVNGVPVVTYSSSSSTKNAGNAVNVGLSYSNGPAYVGYSWLSVDNAIDETHKQKSNLFAASYDLGVVKLAALYSKAKTSNTTKDTLNTVTIGGVVTPFSTVSPVDKSSYMIGLTVPVNAWKFFGEYGKIKDKIAQNAGKNDDAKFLGLGAQYNVSKRTDFYGSFGKYQVGANGSYTIGDASNSALETGTNEPAGTNPLSYQVGIRHKF